MTPETVDDVDAFWRVVADNLLRTLDLGLPPRNTAAFASRPDLGHVSAMQHPPQAAARPSPLREVRERWARRLGWPVPALDATLVAGTVGVVSIITAVVAIAGNAGGDDVAGDATADAAPSEIADAVPPGDEGAATPDGADTAPTPDDGRTEQASMFERPEIDGPVAAANRFTTIIYDQPRSSAKRLGYMRNGAKVALASEEPAGTKGCKGGWYEIEPTGFVCRGNGVTLDVDDPIVRASKLPDTSSPLPFHYGFVRAVLPLYLRIPTKDEQIKSEFKLKEHLEWYAENRDEVDKVVLGANDVPLGADGHPDPNKLLGELGQRKNSVEMGLGQLFGGESEDDEPPFWLADGKRSIPNISGFEVPDSAVFADRARRHFGLSFIGSFPTGPESLERRFAITPELRLAPTTKVKPDTGSPFHGLELGGDVTLPLAFVTQRGAVGYKIDGSEAKSSGDLAFRKALSLTGRFKRVDGAKYIEAKDGTWLDARDVGIAIAPAKWPKAAKDGEKWIQISVSDQVLTLWEGKTPVYATLVSSGRKKYPTEPGTYRIFKKHISATMDSDEGEMSSDEKKDEGIAFKGDGEYGKTIRRGQGTYKLRDVPYIQYFNHGQALHASYWHDVFGKRRSHGCVNLAPIDARRIFFWSEPSVPPGWHGYNVPDNKGTTVIVHE